MWKQHKLTLFNLSFFSRYALHTQKLEFGTLDTLECVSTTKLILLMNTWQNNTLIKDSSEFKLLTISNFQGSIDLYVSHHVSTVFLGLLSPPIPSFSAICRVREFY